MKRFVFTVFLLTVVLIFTSCERHSPKEYQKIIQHADRFKIEFAQTGNRFDLTGAESETLKEVLVAGVRLNDQQQIQQEVFIECYKNDSVIATISAALSGQPHANFNSPNLKCGFQLTYRIGMFLDALDSRH